MCPPGATFACVHTLPILICVYMCTNLDSIFKSRDYMSRKMATYSSILAWEIPWRDEPGRVPSMWLQRVRHD